MRLMPTFALFGLPTPRASIAEFFRPDPRLLGTVSDAGESTTCRAVIGILGLAAFADPAVEFVAVETIVAAVNQTGGRAVFERQHRHARSLGRAVAVENSSRRTDLADFRSAQQPCDVDLMWNLIEQDAPAERGVQFLRPTRPVDEIGVVRHRDHRETADLATGDELAHQTDRRIETVGVADQQCGTALFESFDHLVAIPERQRHWLFDDCMLAGSGGQHGMFAVPLMWRRDIDGFDISSLHELRSACVHRAGVIPSKAG